MIITTILISILLMPVMVTGGVHGTAIGHGIVTATPIMVVW